MRYRPFLELMLFVILVFCSCAPADPSNSPSSLPEITPKRNEVDSLMALIIEDTGDTDAYLAMHGFLRTAESFGVPVRLYRVNPNDSAITQAQTAYADGCVVFCITNPGAKNNDAIAYLNERKVSVVTLFDSADSVNYSVSVDNKDYTEDCARSLGDRLRARSLTGGTILIYSFGNGNGGFSEAVSKYYPEFSVKGLTRKAANDTAALTELTAYIKANPDIVGIYVSERENVHIMMSAISNAGIKDKVSVIGTGLSEKNIELFEKGLYALSIIPNYEAGANAATLCYKLMRGENDKNAIVLNRHIVYEATLEKYKTLFDQCIDWFGIGK
ncbi:MAG: substrate-binding domain-containing protein [Clostridia bacterium]